MNRQSLYFVLEIVLALVLHPLAVIGAWYDICTRRGLGVGKGVMWAIIVLVWGIGPILYVVIDNGKILPWGKRTD